MRISLTTACLIVLFLSIHTQSAYSQTSCSCQNAGDKVCNKGAITCPDGCIAICSANHACYFSCRTNMLDDTRLNLKFQKKEGQQIASALSKETGKTIDFAPYRENARRLYNFELKDSDIWPALVFLDKRGTVKINGIEFRRFREIQSEMKSEKKLSLRVNGIPAREVVSQLALMSQLPLQIQSGDPARLVFVEVNEMPLSDIIKQIAATANVKIDVGNQKPQKK